MYRTHLTQHLFFSLFFLLFANTFVNSQEVLLEADFNECSLPTGWSTNVIGTGPATWNVGLPLNPESDGSSIDGSCMLIIDDDAAGDNTPPWAIEFITPAFDVSRFSTLNLSVDIHFRNVDSSSYFQVLAYDGTDYQLLTTYQRRSTGEQFSEFETFTADLSFFVNSPTMSLVFRYDDGGIWAWWAGIDNLIVTGEGEATNIILENFDDCSLSSGWTTEVLRGTDDWQFGYVANNNTASTSMNGSCFAYFDDDVLGDSAAFSAVRLYSPQFDGTQFANFHLDFDLIFRRYGEQENVSVYLYDGNQLALVKRYSRDFGGPNFNEFIHDQIDLSPFRAEQMQVVFQYEDGNEWGWWTGIDNVKISGSGSINDLCAQALELTLDQACIEGSNENALFFGELPSCGVDSRAGLWYRFTATQTGLIRISAEADFNNLLTLFSGNCGSLSQMACSNRDEQGFVGEDLYVDVVGGNEYFLRLNGESAEFGKTRGRFCLSVSSVDNRPPNPANDDCQQAIILGVGNNCLQGSNLHANFTGPEPSQNNRSRADIWYQFTATGPELEINSEADFADVITLYEGNCGNLTEIACNEYGQSIRTTGLQSGQTYFIQLSGFFSTLEGEVCMSVKEVMPVQVSNDLCSNALTVAVDGACVSASNFGADFDGPSPTCEVFPGSNIWFKFIAPSSGGVKINSGANFVHTIAVYSGNCNDLQEITCLPNPKFCDGYSVLDGLITGETYWLQISSAPNTFGYQEGEVCLHLIDLFSANEFPPFTLAVSVNCVAEGKALLDIQVAGGQGSYTFEGNSSTDTLFSGDEYTVIVRDVNGCELNAIGTIRCGNLPCSIILSEDKSDVSCFGQADGSISINLSQGEGPYTYRWSNGATTATLSNLSPGNYSVTVTDANGCPGTLSTTITQPSPLDIELSVTNESASGANDGTATVDPSGGTSPYTFLWSTNDTEASVSGLAPGFYEVTVTDAAGCTRLEVVTINSFDCSGLSILLTMEPVSCNGRSDGQATVEVNGSAGPFTYLWSNDETASSITGLSTDTYFVTVTDENGCQVAASILVSEPEILQGSIVSQTNLLCAGDSIGATTVAANGGTAPYEFAWSNGAVGASVNNLFAGNYRVTITDVNACIATTTVSIEEPMELSLSFLNQQDVSCFGGNNGSASGFVEGGTPGYIYLWNDPLSQQSSTALDLSAGTYQLEVIDANGCTTSQEVVIGEPQEIQLVIDDIIDDVGGTASGAISVTPTGGVTPYSYNWFLDGGVISMQEDISGLDAGEYTLLITDANGCTFTSNTIAVKNLTAVSDPELEAQIRLRPNPTFGKFRVELSLKTLEPIRLLIYSIDGKLLEETPESLVKQRTYAFDLSNYSSGIYQLWVQGKNRNAVFRVVVVK